jgi:hypothetical protein
MTSELWFDIYPMVVMAQSKAVVLTAFDQNDLQALCSKQEGVHARRAHY